MSSLSAITLFSRTAFMRRSSIPMACFAINCSRNMAILQAFTKTAIDADCLLVQGARRRQIAGEQAGGRERAQAARQGLGGAEWTHEIVGLAQDALALIDAVRQQPRRAGPQQHAS